MLEDSLVEQYIHFRCKKNINFWYRYFINDKSIGQFRSILINNHKYIEYRRINIRIQNFNNHNHFFVYNLSTKAFAEFDDYLHYITPHSGGVDSSPAMQTLSGLSSSLSAAPLLPQASTMLLFFSMVSSSSRWLGGSVVQSSFDRFFNKEDFRGSVTVSSSEDNTKHNVPPIPRKRAKGKDLMQQLWHHFLALFTRGNKM